MKSWLIVSIFLVATATWVSAQAPQEQIKIPQQCSDVLSVKVCDKIDSMATSLKLKVETAKEAFVDAYQKGKRTADEVIESCKTFYLEKVKSKTCEDFVSVETCTKLRKLATTLKLKSQVVGEYVKKALLEGKNKVVEIYQKVQEYYNNELKGKSCEELLGRTKINPAVCTTLRKAAGAVKVKVERVTTIVREALINGYNNATAIVKNGTQRIKNFVKDIKCEQLLNPGLCSTLREYSMKVKVAFPRIMETVKDLLIKGYNIATGFLKAVYKITDAFIDCEHIFTPDSCKLIKEKITSIGGKLSTFGTAVREYTMKVVNKTKDIYHKILTFTKAKWCKWFKVGCSTSKRSLAVVKRSAAMKELLQKYKDMLAKGIAAAKEQLKQSIEKLMDAMKIVDGTIRDALKKAIDNGKVKYTELKELLKKMLETSTGNQAVVISKTKRDLKVQLQQALTSAHAHLKSAIKYLLTKSSEELKKMHNYIQSLLSKIFDDKTKRDIDDSQMLEIMGEELVKLETNKISENATLLADEILDETFEDIMEVEEEKVFSESMQKRDLTSGLNKIKEFFGNVGNKMTEVLSKLRDFNVDSIKEAMEKAGLKLINVAEDLLKKIEEALKQ